MCVHELHISDKHTPRRRHRYCPLWRGPPPPGNNSKSRVINPSAAPYLPSLPPFVLLSAQARAVGVHACAYGCLCVASSPSPVHPSLFVFPTSFSFTRACMYAHAQREEHAISIRSLLFGIYVCDVHCCKLLPCYGHVPTGLIEDPLELALTRRKPETQLNVQRTYYTISRLKWFVVVVIHVQSTLSIEVSR